MISIIIPVIDQEEITEQCLINIAAHTHSSHEVILIDNGSDRVPNYQNVKIIHNVNNVGLPFSLRQGMMAAEGDILAFIHNDTLIWEYEWEKKVEKAFLDRPQLGMAGFFGAMGVGPDGGRAQCYSNLQGRQWGVKWSDGQSNFLEGVMPAATLDGLGLLFRTSVLKELDDQLDILSLAQPLHHFYDRIWPLHFIENGWDVATIGVACDHRGGTTANSSDKYHNAAKKWCENRGVELVQDNADLTMYYAAEKVFKDKFAHRLPLYVDENYNYRWSR